MTKKKNKSIKGLVRENGHTLNYEYTSSAVNDLKELYGIDAIAEIEAALKQELKRDPRNARNLGVRVPKVKKSKTKK